MNAKEQQLKKLVDLMNQVMQATVAQDVAEVERLQKEIQAVNEAIAKEQEEPVQEEQKEAERIGEKVGAAIGIGINKTGKAIEAAYVIGKAYTNTVLIPVAKKTGDELKKVTVKTGSELKAQTKGFFARLKEEVRK